MGEQRKWAAILVAVAGAGVTAVSAYLLATWPPDPPDGLAAATAPPAGASGATGAAGRREPTPDRPEQGAGRLMVVLGDEFTAASDESSGPEWPRLLADDLGWQTQVDAVDGSGFLYPGKGESFGARVDAVLALQPDVIVVAGGKNDLGRFPTVDIAARADEVLGRLTEGAPDASLVVLSPFSKGRPGPLTAELTTALRDLAAEYDATFVDVSHWLVRSTDLFLDDSQHPVDEGQALVADRLRDRLDALVRTTPSTG